MWILMKGSCSFGEANAKSFLIRSKEESELFFSWSKNVFYLKKWICYVSVFRIKFKAEWKCVANSFFFMLSRFAVVMFLLSMLFFIQGLQISMKYSKITVIEPRSGAKDWERMIQPKNFMQPVLTEQFQAICAPLLMLRNVANKPFR